MPRSNHKWCAHPISHQGARKSGPSALRSRGNRPIDNDLAAFITQEYYQANANVGFVLSEGDLLCRTCYETESTRFHTHLAVEDANSRESDGKHPRRSTSSFYSSDLVEVDVIAVDSPVFSPLSAESGSMTDTAEMKYKLEQSKELLLADNRSTYIMCVCVCALLIFLLSICLLFLLYVSLSLSLSLSRFSTIYMCVHVCGGGLLLI